MSPDRPPQLDRILARLDAGDYVRVHASLLQLARGNRPHPDVLSALADVLLRLGKGAQAEHFARLGASLYPTVPATHHTLGNTLLTLGRLGEAEASLRHAVELAPRVAVARVSLGNVIRKVHGPCAAVEVLTEALKFCGEDAPIMVNLAHELNAIGRVEEGLPLIRRASDLEPMHVLIADGVCAMSNYAPGVTAREQFEAAERFGRLVRLGIGPAPACPRWPPLPGGRLRIGLLSPDLREHAVGHLIRALIEHTDRAHAEIACYYVGGREDEMSQTLRKSADLWRHVPLVPPADLASLIRHDKVHILVDLAGHTASHRLRTMAMRPAPLQATYMGYPNTTGLDCVDLRISDAIADPLETGRFNTERLAHMPVCFLSFRPPEWLPPVTPIPSLSTGFITFGCFGSMLKQSGALFDLWADVLKAVPGSRLLLKNASLGEEGMKRALAEVFSKRGVEPARLDLEPPGASARDVMPLYARVDVSLDTAPYTGTTTLCESLAMGVPVVSMSGETSPSRVSRSILSAVGLQEHVATDRDEYIRIAVRLANDEAGRRELRTTLRQRFLASSICDGPGFAQRFVGVLLAEWRQGESATPSAGGGVEPRTLA